jgi:hypothetical protein
LQRVFGKKRKFCGHRRLKSGYRNLSGATSNETKAMFRLIRDFRIAQVIGVMLIAGGASQGTAEAAGLVGYRNDTNQTIVVQSIAIVNGVARRSRPQMLYPGEVALDGIAAQGKRKITVTDPKKPSVALFQDEVVCNDDVFFSIRIKASTIPIKGQPAKPPEVELVRTRPPAMPGPSNPNRPSKPNPPKKP